MISKKAVGPVIAIALLIVVSVVATIGFQNWYGSYQSKTFSDIEIKAKEGSSRTNIEGIVNNQLYFKNYLKDNLTILEIKVGNKTCDISSINFSLGINNISLGKCTNNLTSQIQDLVVITNENIFVKKHYFKDSQIVQGSLAQSEIPVSSSQVIGNSLLFDGSDYLSNTFAQSGDNRNTATVSFWLKKSGLDPFKYYTIFRENGFFDGIQFYDNELDIFFAGAASYRVVTKGKFRDSSDWSHFVINFDTIQMSNSRRVRVYVDGEEITDFETANYPTELYDFGWGTASEHLIGQVGGNSNFLEGYLSDFYFIDGQVLGPEVFGQENSYGKWQPKEVTIPTATYDYTHSLSVGDRRGSITVTDSGCLNLGTNSNLVNFGGTGNTYYKSGNPDVTGDWIKFDFGTPIKIKEIIGSWVASTDAVYTGDGNWIWQGSVDGSTNWVNVSEVFLKGDYGYPNYYQPINLSQNNNEFRYYRMLGISGSATNNWWYGFKFGIETATPHDFGKNGFHLTFENSSNLGQDFSGNNNSWSVNSDPKQTYDSPENNFATWNSLKKQFGASNFVADYVTFSQGNLRAEGSTTGTTNSDLYLSNIKISDVEKSYWEVELVSLTGTYWYVGVQASNDVIPTIGNVVVGWDQIYVHPAISDNLTQSGLDSIVAGDIIGFAYDRTTGILNITRNGVPYGVGITIKPELRDDLYIFGTDYNAATKQVIILNTGQTNFTYAPPPGFKSLSSKNMKAPTVNPKEGFDILTYLGTGANQNITSLSFSPDLVWIKDRTDAYGHVLEDSVRGAQSSLYSHLTDGADLNANYILQFLEDGFEVGSLAGTNALDDNYVAWNWKEGPEYGFDILTTVHSSGVDDWHEHSLGKEPEFLIYKIYDADGNAWVIYDKDLGEDQYLYLSTAGAAGTAAGIHGVNSTHFKIASSQGPGNYLAYLFTSIEGFSKIGSYTGNGNVDGPFIYTGFKPKFVMVKKINLAQSWGMNIKNGVGGNSVPDWVWADQNIAEDRNWQMDFLSNGFKIRATDGWSNTNGDSYIYLAFAESPMSTNSN